MRLGKQARISIFLLLTALLVGGTVAYFTTTEQAHNIVSISGVNIKLYELADPTGDGSTLVPFHDLENVEPGVTYSKIPYVENIDVEPVWVRARFTLTETLPDGTTISIPDYTPVIELGDVGENWKREQDGLYYFDNKLTGGASTEPIFKTVKFKPEIDDRHQGSVYTLKVETEATQVANNGNSPIEAKWTENGEEE